ncbi:MAG: hypothetical protein ACRD5H_01630 [Nitrososphaerales archaeon]
MQSHRSYVASYRLILDLLKNRRYAAILAVSGIAYAFVYMVVVGIISYVPGLSSASGIPVFRLTSVGVSAIPADNIFFFIFYGALAFLVASSFLVGTNMALIFYSRKIARACRVKEPSKPEGLFGLLPAFFTSFSCCGGGLLALAIGPTAFSSLSLYSEYMAPLTVAVLAAGTYFMSRKISKTEHRYP